MNKAWVLILLFGAMVAAQWWVPVSMITGSNRILEEGIPMKFRCAPVDPNDPFRGKYIVLQFDISQFTTDTSQEFINGDEVYLTFHKDSLGFDQLNGVFPDPPNNKLFLKTSIDYINRYNKSILEINFNLPFKRLYLEETKAPKAEDLYRSGISDTTGKTYGLVYLLNGEARIKDVIIRDTSILERLRKLEK